MLKYSSKPNEFVFYFYIFILQISERKVLQQCFSFCLDIQCFLFKRNLDAVSEVYTEKYALAICTVERLVLYMIPEFIRIMSTKETRTVQITIPKSVLKKNIIHSDHLMNLSSIKGIATAGWKAESCIKVFLPATKAALNQSWTD